MDTKLKMPLVKTLLLILLFTFGKFYSQTNNGAVGINTSSPNLNSVLDVVSGNNNKGILIPRLTESQRNAIVINKPKDDGLTIYNTTEDCFNYWSFADDEWKSVCGQLGKGLFTIDCSATQAMGSYVKGKELTSSNYLSVKVNVTKVGNYIISEQLQTDIIFMELEYFSIQEYKLYRFRDREFLRIFRQIILHLRLMEQKLHVPLQSLLMY